MTLYYLAQVYQFLEETTESVKYILMTLEKQLEVKKLLFIIIIIIYYYLLLFLLLL